MELALVECPKCHAEMFDGAHFCVRCGGPLAARSTARAVPSRPPAADLWPTPGEQAPAELESLSGAVSRALGEEREQSALTAGAKPAKQQRTPAVSTPLASDSDFSGWEAPTPANARQASSDRAEPPLPRRQAGMPEHSRDDVLRRARMKQSLKRAGLAGVDLSGTSLEGVDFSRADLEGANLEDAKLKGAVFKGANLRNARLKGADLTLADLDKADLSDAVLEGARVDGASIKRATLIGAKLGGASLSASNLSGSELGNADLRGATLKGADLSYADLTGASLAQADLSGARLERACFDGALLNGAILSGVDARQASFRSADLGQALLHHAKLGGAIMSGARSEGALAEWLDTSAQGDGSARKEGAHALGFLRGVEELEPPSATRYFGKGDVLRDAVLEFGKNAQIVVDGQFENCSILLGDGALFTVGESSVLKNCSIVGNGAVVVNGRFFERSSPGITGVRSLVVSSRGGIVGGIEQAADGTLFAFEPGCRLRVKILRPRLLQAAE